MEDIMFSYPEHCGENNCPVGWRLYHVWSAKRGYTVADSDGDHEPLSRRDYNELWAQNDAMWLEYAKDVLETGNDVLDNYLACPTVPAKETWTVEFRESVIGLIIEVKRGRNGKWIPAGDAPEHVREYLNAQKPEGSASHWISGDFKTMAEVYALKTCEVKPRSTGAVWITFTLEVQKPNPNYQRELRRIVKADIERLEKANK